VKPAFDVDEGGGIGVVIIGRNEGERLRRCLLSCSVVGARRVYVDSGSTDGSVELATALGARVVQLDMSRPFTAARARNAGLSELQRACSDVALVQFIDGDCELMPDWLDAAAAFLLQREDIVAVTGRLRERFPQKSVFNQMCDIEWNTALGEARSFGGIVLIRVATIMAAGGFREDLIAGEEPELCVRLRSRGARLWRLDRDMAWHDANILRLSQWWRRTFRSGHAFAEGAALHGEPPERHFVAETRRALLWGAGLPVTIALAACVTPFALLALLVYPLQWLRIGATFKRAGSPIPWIYAGFLVLGRLPEAQGALKFHLTRFSGRRTALIEYK
jgi:glycosyltransferase involved in cell wall biosynthesis